MKQLFLLFTSLISLTSFSQNIERVTIGECDRSSDPEYIYINRLVQKTVLNDTLYLDIGIVRNCALETKVELSKSQDSLFIKIQNISDIWTACICCFELNIVATGITDTNFVLMLEKERIKFIDENGEKLPKKYTEIKTYSNKFIFPEIGEIMDSESENQFYNDSLKVGYWSYYYEGTKRLNRKTLYFINDAGQSQTNWYANFDKKGNMIEVCRITGIDEQGARYANCILREDYDKLFFDGK